MGLPSRVLTHSCFDLAITGDRNHRSAAEVCVAAAVSLSGGETAMRHAAADAASQQHVLSATSSSARAVPWLRKAVEQFYKAGDYSKMMGLLEDCPGLEGQLRGRFGDLQTALQQAAIALMSAGEHKRAVAAIHMLPSTQLQVCAGVVGRALELCLSCDIWLQCTV